ncbi:MAG: pseudouridine synthase [Sandaracinaceae bacterium]|nr:pseudouridine synthase [Sandaracinaceae bacterium]
MIAPVRRGSFDPARIVYEDGDLIAIDKPEGVSSQAADPAHPDDVVHRLALFLAERAGRPGEKAYLGVHQRLDRETSGVLLYATRKEANAGLARELEGRRADKRYVALVRGWKGGARRLEHALAERDGRAVVAPRDRRAKRAVSHVRVLERDGERALLEVRIETGRTHQIRAQLASEGAPVIGDRLYGGAPAPRLMLHARSIALAHPLRGTPLRVEAPLPAIFARMLRGEREEPLEEALARAVERRFGLARREGLDTYRLVNEGGDGLAGLAVDVYDEWLVAHVYSEAIEGRLEAVLDALEALGPRGVYLKPPAQAGERHRRRARGGVRAEPPGPRRARTRAARRAGERPPLPRAPRRGPEHGHLPRSAREPPPGARARERRAGAQPLRVHVRVHGSGGGRRRARVAERRRVGARARVGEREPRARGPGVRGAPARGRRRVRGARAARGHAAVRSRGPRPAHPTRRRARAAGRAAATGGASPRPPCACSPREAACSRAATTGGSACRSCAGTCTRPRARRAPASRR